MIVYEMGIEPREPVLQEVYKGRDKRVEIT